MPFTIVKQVVLLSVHSVFILPSLENLPDMTSILQQQNAFLQQQLREANDHLMEASHKVDDLLRKVSSLEELRVRKNQEKQKQRNFNNRTALMQTNIDIKEYRVLLPDRWKDL